MLIEIQKDTYDKLNSIPVEQILKKNEPQREQVMYEDASFKRAEREPLPTNTDAILNPVADLFTFKTSGGKELQIRKMKAMDISIFKLIDSPFYKLIMGDIEDKKDVTLNFKALFPNEEIFFSIIYQFTHPVKDVYKLVKTSIEAYKDKIIDESAEFTAQDVLDITAVILNHIGIVNQARVDFDVIESEDKKKL